MEPIILAYGTTPSHDYTGPITYPHTKDVWWYESGQLHKVDGPAIIRSNGDKWWYKNGKLHREDGPAVECLR